MTIYDILQESGKIGIYMKMIDREFYIEVSGENVEYDENRGMIHFNCNPILQSKIGLGYSKLRRVDNDKKICSRASFNPDLTYYESLSDREVWIFCQLNLVSIKDQFSQEIDALIKA
jgi:hypothetical protein